MKSGKLNNIVIIESPTTMINEYGEDETIQTYSEKLKTRCDVVNDSGTRVNDNGEIFYPYNKTFVFWDYMDDKIDERDRIIFKGKPYRIITKDLIKENKTLFVKTELINE